MFCAMFLLNILLPTTTMVTVITTAGLADPETCQVSSADSAVVDLAAEEEAEEGGEETVEVPVKP
tara:strand:+ start:96 stop:290 length:195 start_codon:yes stop_codon:yes gene_type:complete